MVVKEVERSRTLAVDLLAEVWRSIDHAAMGSSRRMGLYDEIAGRIRSASRERTLEKFTEALCAKLGVRTLSPRAGNILGQSSREEKTDVLELFRTEPIVLVAEFRARKDSL